MQPTGAAPAPADRSALAIISLVLGVLGLCAWIVPLCGFPISIVGLILGILSARSARRGMAIAGIVLAVMTLLAAVANAAFGAYLGLNGDLFSGLR